MIVCLCRVVCDRRLRTVVQEGAETLDEVERACGAGGDCGSCRSHIEEIIEEQVAGSSSQAA